ncbi:MAG TPA: hypothetical protein VHD60_00845 [Candidatus Saccharimonadales bacterium]|nr:hypothetical protein [Candidatus Saccharimonadales bacterium]
MFGIGKWKTEEWEGKVVKKEVFEDRSGEDDIVFYYLYVEMPDGNVVKKKYWDRKFFDQFNEGDKIVKRPGEKKPTKG